MKAVIAASMLALASSAQASDLDKLLATSSRTSHAEDSVRVNLDTTFRIAVRKSREGGEQDLHRISHNSDFEESYLFLPEFNLWIEVGYDEEPDKVRSDEDFISAVLKNHTAVLYHSHPTNSMPSYRDFVSMATRSARGIVQQLKPLTHRAATPMGITEYKIKPGKLEDRIKALQSASLRGYEVSNIFLEFYLSTTESGQYYKAIQPCYPKCKSLNTNSFVAQLRPYPAITVSSQATK